MYVRANPFTLDCFSNPRKRNSPTHTRPSNVIDATGKSRHVLIVFTVAYEYGEVKWKLVSSTLVRYAMAFEVSLMLIILQWSLEISCVWH